MNSNVWAKLEANAYRNQAPYPESPSRPMLRVTATSAEARQYADALDEYDAAMKTYREHVAAYHAISAAQEVEFRLDLEAHYGMVGHVKADLLYGKAWERGHAYGLSEVASVYADMVDLVL